MCVLVFGRGGGGGGFEGGGGGGGKLSPFFASHFPLSPRNT